MLHNVSSIKLEGIGTVWAQKIAHKKSMKFARLYQLNKNHQFSTITI